MLDIKLTKIFILLKMEKEKNPIKETFAILKFKRSTQDILDESDKESWDE